MLSCQIIETLKKKYLNTCNLLLFNPSNKLSRQANYMGTRVHGVNKISFTGQR